MSEGVWERSMTGAMEQSKGRRAMEHRIIFATSNQGKMREIREILKGLGTEILSMKEAGVQADIVEDGDTFEAAGVTWKVIETPGHTIGSCCYYIESEDLLFAGDTLFRTSYGRVDLPTGDAMSMLASVKKLLTLPETVKVYPGHMGVTSIEYEKKHNPLARY